MPVMKSLWAEPSVNVTRDIQGRAVKKRLIPAIQTLVLMVENAKIQMDLTAPVQTVFLG